MEEEIVLMEENDIEEINIEEENYSGKPYVLPIATKETLGGIKVGENLTIDEDGTLNAQAGGSSESNNIGTYTLINNSDNLYLEPEVITKLNFDNVYKNTTNGGLIPENGGVRIGKGVSQILILSKWNSWIYDHAKYIYVYKNGTTYEMQSYPINVYSANITSYVDVAEGDYIEIYGWQNSTETRKINSNWQNTNAKIIIMR